MPTSPPVIALILAAGRSRRFGSDKRRASLPDGARLLAATVAVAQRCFAEVYVVLRPEDDPQALGLGAEVRLVRCAAADLGMGHSLAAGVRAVAEQRSRAVAVLLGDMPWIAESSLQHLAYAADSERIVFPLYAGERGHPVLFGRRYWRELEALTGDHGAKAVLDAHEEAWLGIELDDPGVLRDVDTPEALSGG
ncbi:nucleotidyltransferase family protein [Pseudomonas cavernicola]|uniref:Nucleotidyltransferase family protein n=1 Tax=Pseudomonas cavernicola TaxID=2320866 RepID=A0A418XHS9_9PSED|nr:nucleotidyltransferase family protein [Pseudomonas cavernicola]RJG12024.1 nucleotidyltransferase family protein [Pseudomonas cavernicola]